METPGMDKTPLDYNNMTYSWVLGMAIWGGLASYISKVRKGNAKFSFAELIGEIVISAFVGVMTFFVCESVISNQIITAAMIGVSSHMGSRAIFIAEKWLENYVKKRLNVDDN